MLILAIHNQYINGTKAKRKTKKTFLFLSPTNGKKILINDIKMVKVERHIFPIFFFHSGL